MRILVKSNPNLGWMKEDTCRDLFFWLSYFLLIGIAERSSGVFGMDRHLAEVISIMQGLCLLGLQIWEGFFFALRYFGAASRDD